jgi:AcrR family transcriptional regulator
MPKPTFENLPEEKRRRLVDLAIDEFTENPYAQASLSRIVARAGIAKGSVYQYFNDKLDLYRWLLTSEVARRKQEHLASTVPPAPGEDVFERLGAMYLAGLQFLLAHPRLARIGARALEPSGDIEADRVHDELRRMGLDGMRAMLADARLRGEVATWVDIDLAAHVVAQVMGLGLTGALLDRLGTDLRGLVAKPSLARRIDDAALKALVDGAVTILRRGLGPELGRGRGRAKDGSKGAKR